MKSTWKLASLAAFALAAAASRFPQPLIPTKAPFPRSQPSPKTSPESSRKNARNVTERELLRRCRW